MESKKSIILSTFQVTIVTFFIKFLGLIKQSVLASQCGASLETDSFFVATGIIVSLSSVIFSAISISLLTIHTNRLTKYGWTSANNLINAVLRVFIPIALVISLVFIIFSRNIAHFFAPVYNQDEVLVLARYIRYMALFFVLCCYYLIINVILETDKRFMPGRFFGFFQNLFLIIAALFFYPKYGMDVLIFAFVLSGIAQCLLVRFFCGNTFRLIIGKINETEAIKRLLRLSVPLIVGSAIYEINDIVDKQIATGLGEGSASYLAYGSTINEIVTGVIVASISTVLFSHFVTWVAEGDDEKVKRNLNNVLSMLTIIILPVMIMCIVSGDVIVTLLYGRGNFGNKQIIATYGVVIGYALGFVFQAARANIVKVFYAYQDTRTPMINGAISVFINICLSVTLSRFFGITGVALATSIAMFVVTIMLGFGVKKHLPGFRYSGIIREVLKGCVAAIITSIAVYIIKRNIHINTLVDFILEGLVCVILYLLILKIEQSNTLTLGLTIIKKKIGNK